MPGPELPYLEKATLQLHDREGRVRVELEIQLGPPSREGHQVEADWIRELEEVDGPIFSVFRPPRVPQDQLTVTFQTRAFTYKVHDKKERT